jgi:peroxiredoxin
MKNEIKEEIDFTLMDTRDQNIQLSKFRGKKAVLLVLMRGFA